MEWRARARGHVVRAACVIGMRPPPSPQAAPTVASALCPYRCPWTTAIQADPTLVCPTWTPAIATYGHWWRAHLRCVQVQLVQRVACLYQSCLPVPSQSPVGHGERDSSTAAGRRPQARRMRPLLRLPPFAKFENGRGTQRTEFPSHLTVHLSRTESATIHLSEHKAALFRARALSGTAGRLLSTLSPRS